MGGNDTRAVSEVMGAILVFSLLVTALGAYQAVIVPNQNEKVEFRHNKEVQRDFIDLRNSIHRSSTDGEDTSVAVELGVRYPTRALTLNPPEQGGTLQGATTGPPGGSTQDLAIENATAIDGEVADYWDNTTKNFTTGRVVYTPSYSIYHNAPQTVIENGIVYNKFDGGEDLPLSGQRVVSGREISLVAIESDLSRSQVDTAAVDVNAVSAGTEKVSITNASNGDNVTVRIPTNLSEEVWVGQLLADQIDGAPSDLETCGDMASHTAGNADDDRYIHNCTYTKNSDFNVLTLRMERDTTYTLRLSKVSVEKNAPSPEPMYIVPTRGEAASITSSQQQQLTVQVRDKFDNPVSGEMVKFDLLANPALGELKNSTHSANQVSVTTNEEGYASVTFIPGQNNVNVAINATTSVTSNPATTQSERRNATFTVSVGNPNPNTPGVGSTVNPAGPLVLSDSTIFASSGTSCTPNTGAGEGNGSTIGDCYVNVDITNNDGSNDLEIKEIRFNAYVGQSPGASTGGSGGLPDEIQICDGTNSDVFQRQSSYEPFFDSQIDDGDT